MYRSFALTVRPRDGISDETVDAMKKWLTKCEHSVAVLEKDTVERHLHAQIWFSATKARGDICKQLQRICERTIQDWDTAQLKVLRTGVKIAYSDWYLDYLVENDLKEKPNIILNNPPDKTMDYYPTEEEQENVKAVKTAVDPRMAQMEIECLEYLGERDITKRNVAEYLADAMFVKRTMKCILQQRDRKALCETLHAYMNKKADVNLFLEKTQKDLKWDALIEEIKHANEIEIEY